MTRIGIGTDTHFFTTDPGKRLVLAGFPIAGHRGVEADSDGDIALHALCNALSTALGGKSMGFYVSEMCRNGVTDSARYVETFLEKMRAQELRIRNVTLMFECVAPHIDPLIDGIKSTLAQILGITESQIGIAASNGDRHDDRIRVLASVLLE